jgi:sulfite reductase (NADPH) flavoprotein alpha-component
MMDALPLDTSRLWGAALIVSSYLAMCAAIWHARRSHRESKGSAEWLILHASQTGTAEDLARRSAALLHDAGFSLRLASLDQVRPAELASATRTLIVASTYGEGDAPDSAARFMRELDQPGLSLAGMGYALLALGDRSYAQFCGFGRLLDERLQALGAQPLVERIDADRCDSAALETWQHHLSHLAGSSDLKELGADTFTPWRVSSRKLLNPGSAGAPAYEVQLVPGSGPLPDWEPGDLMQVCPPADPDLPREYSIASVPGEGHVKLLVRLHRREDGSDGAASGWLTRGAGQDDVVAARVRAHSRFRLGANADRPLILIGNGTGLSGLRAHLRARMAQESPRTWLLFGERQRAHDLFWAEELESWRARGMELSLAFSRDGGQLRYVQDLVEQEAARLRMWAEEGAAIYVCGSLQGMAPAVHAALEKALGATELAALADSGRYRRDVY